MEKTKGPSLQSMIALSALVFFISDVQNGVGPFLAIYLKSTLNWNPEQIGLALATMTISAAIMQLPNGWLVDYTQRKRLLLSASCALIGLGCLIILFFPALIPILAAQSFIGVATAVIPPSIAAITIGLVGREVFPKRVSINETCTHMGTCLTALIAGIAGQFLGHHWILYVVGFSSILSILSIQFIKSSEIDYNRARELGTDNSTPKPIWQLLKRKEVIIFAISIILFHLANAAQLPLVAQLLAEKNPKIDALFMAASIFLGQFVMIGVAYTVGLYVNTVGRKQIFLLAFLILPIRALLYTFSSNPIYLLSIQLLDGIGAGIFGVIAIVIISDLAAGTGRFNLFQGLVALCTALGSASSNLISGTIAKTFGYNAGFLTLSLLALLALTFFQTQMPETKPK